MRPKSNVSGVRVRASALDLLSQPRHGPLWKLRAAAVGQRPVLLPRELSESVSGLSRRRRRLHVRALLLGGQLLRRPTDPGWQRILRGAVPAMSLDSARARSA